MTDISSKSLPQTVSLPQAGAPSEPISEAAAGAILTVDLGAVRENYRRLKARLGGVSCAGVVKADGYGIGAAPVAAALMAEGCDIFFVAHLAGGVLLRKALGSDPAIYVLNGIPPGAEREAVAAGLCTVVNSASQLAAWREMAGRVGHKLPAAVQVDSGMSRLGMAPEEVKAIAQDPQAFDGVELTFVMSHLACADEPEQPANEQQRLEFERLRRMLPGAPASLANSSGIFLGQRYHYDLVRPGAALYGINPTPAKDNPMLPVVRLQAKVIQTRMLEAGAGVGYGHTFHTKAPLAAATISLGYGDGWHRRAASAAWFENVRLPFIGRVSMDSIILDISALPPGKLKAGDLVELIGPSSQTVDQVAGQAGTIGYEVLTSLGHRFHRRYVNG
ncbi:MULTISPECIES: alanine racemase [unclassified Mesorhizobium]|uniref:alanine racemase n=1 Tax=unclassified Mesorhizobium TaxID=325217 RepID=UPI0003CE097B|nr:alanine racemase [Mesorhizobium sp. LSHC420B00]ESX76724.1 alanine racemase [Mesorhizobium sp. LSHC420B00]